MSFFQSFRLALKSLATSRSGLCSPCLGIITGVAAVIIIISLGDGMNDMINSEFEKMGTNPAPGPDHGPGLFPEHHGG